MRRSEFKRRLRRKPRKSRGQRRSNRTPATTYPNPQELRDHEGSALPPADRRPFEPPATTDIPDLTAQELLINAARHAAAAGEGERAAAIYRELLELNPEHLLARREMAMQLHENGDEGEALELLDRCIEHEPDDVSCLVHRAGIFGARGDFQLAEADLHRALSVDPANVSGHQQLGLLMSRRALWSEALPFYRRAIELDPGSALAYRYLGDALNHVDDLQGALQAYSRSVELAPYDVKALRGLGVIHDRLGQPREAAAMYRKSREMANP